MTSKKAPTHGSSSSSPDDELLIEGLSKLHIQALESILAHARSYPFRDDAVPLIRDLEAALDLAGGNVDALDFIALVALGPEGFEVQIPADVLTELNRVRTLHSQTALDVLSIALEGPYDWDRVNISRIIAPRPATEPRLRLVIQRRDWKFFDLEMSLDSLLRFSSRILEEIALLPASVIAATNEDEVNDFQAQVDSTLHHLKERHPEVEPPAED